MTADAPIDAPAGQATGISRYALAFIFATMLIDTIGLGIIIPVAPKLIATLTHDPLSAAARWGGWLLFTFAGMQFLCAPLVGNLSDRFGRRPVLILSLVSLAGDYALTGWAPTIGWLFLGRALSGAAGAAYPIANAYIADVSPPERRAANFGLVGAAFGLGFIVGPALGGLIGEHFGVRAPFFAAAALALANALFGLVVLNESLPPAKRRRFEWARANPLGSLVALRRFPGLFALIGVVVLTQFAHDSLPATWTYYTMLRFGWGPGEVAWSLVAIGAFTALSFGLLPGLVVPRTGARRAVVIGLSCAALGYAGYAFSARPWMLYAAMAVWALGGIGAPALTAIITGEVPDNEQGELQGALASLGSLVSIGAPVLMTQLFGIFTGPRAPVYFPGASFLAAALFEGAGLIWFVTAMRRRAT